MQVSAKDLVIGYRRTPVLSGINLSIDRGDFWGIVGPNGAGKTTLVKTLLGIIRPLGGVVERAPEVRFGYVPQRGVIDDIFPVTVRDVVLMGRYPFLGIPGRLGKKDHDLATHFIEKVGMTLHVDKPYRALSGGQKQRTLIARALTGEPDILVLDEPTAGMDIAGESTIMQLLLDLHKESRLSLVMITHSLNLIANYAHKLIIIHRENKTVKIGDTETLLTNATLKEIYQLDVDAHLLHGHKYFFVHRHSDHDHPDDRGKHEHSHGKGDHEHG
ncbi:MAG: metal ABC transporter ATP-binding protein [Candidatus Manganitrophaceae bacterium]|nr:MAG: metal ABC transporter ATP-binding protein [Candidatus Manganitrophaceae bacterium]